MGISLAYQAPSATLAPKGYLVVRRKVGAHVRAHMSVLSKRTERYVEMCLS